MSIPDPTFLKRVLVVDALTCVAMGVALLVAPGHLSELLGLPVMLLRSAALILLAFAVLLVWTSRQPVIASGLIRLVVSGNLAWVAASFALVLGGLVPLTAVGTAFVLAQGAAVLVIAGLEAFGYRRAYA